MRRIITAGYVGAFLLAGGIVLGWFTLSEKALAGTPVGSCTRDSGSGSYSCSHTPAIGYHIAINANPGLCHGDIEQVGDGYVIAMIVEDVSYCPVDNGDTMYLQLRPPAHPTPAVATCTIVSLGASYYSCSSFLQEGLHVELNDTPGICHVTITSVLSGVASGGAAYYRVAENVSGCTQDVGSASVFQYTVPGSGPPTITCPDVPRDQPSFFRDWIYDFAGRGYLTACRTDLVDSNGQPLPPVAFDPNGVFTRAQAAVWALRLLNRNGSYAPPSAAP